MIDIKLIREQPEALKAALSKKKFKFDLDTILELDRNRRTQIKIVDKKRAEQGTFNKVMAAADKNSPEFKEYLSHLKILAADLKALEVELQILDKAWHASIMTIPNIPHDSVPEGRAETDNEVISTWGDIEAISKYARPHYDIPGFAKLIDFERGSKVTQAGFPFYVGPMAKLVRSLITFYLDAATAAGYIEFLPPIMVNAASAMATGQLPDKEGMMYTDVAEGIYMVPTAEIPVTNFYRDEILEEKQLPMYRCAYTPCFRREAGSWGKDVRGLNRLHQFDKVELVKWVHPHTSFEELESLKLDAERLLQKLELPYRVLGICTGDMGFAHSKQYDLEVWAGGQKRWLEVSSCSNFTDFQARRANIRYRTQKEGKVETVHTLNGSGLAVPRVLAAILENNLQANGSIRIPKALQPYYGQEFLRFEA